MSIPGLTGVRGVAALWVVLFHIQGFAPALHLPLLAGLPVVRNGWEGVDLFFLLSGFVLMLGHEDDFHRLGKQALLRFAWLRFFRIYPLATVVLLLILALVLIDRPFAAWVAAGNIPPNLTLSSFIRTLLLATRWWTPVDGDWNQPVWSLSAEIMGYAVFPLLAFAAGRVTSRAGLLVLTLVCLAYPTGIAWMHGQLVNSDLFWGAGTRMAGAFTGGILLCRLHSLTPDSQRRWQGAIADAGLAGLLVAQALPAGAILGIFCFGAIIYGLASNEGWTARLCASRPAMLLGRISFPLYLVHVTVLSWLVFNVATYAIPTWQAAIGLLLAVVFCLCLSWLLHVGIEQPAHNFARSRARRPEAAREGSEPIAVATPSR